jgi:exopolysaccharide production protein ExoZ
MSEKKSSRIETLDWLRGLMALSIMFYHLTIWIIAPQDSSSPLGRLGVYGVSIFFILSGLSMAIVYNRYIKSVISSVRFFIRRIFRIWPLMWIVCIMAVLPDVVKTGNIDWYLMFLNVTTLFGFLEPTAYIATGAWSIGNEMVYYAVTPLIIILYNYRKWAGNLFFLLSLAIGMYFAFVLLNPGIKVAAQWELYVNPFNNFFLYVLGFAIYYNFRDIEFNKTLNLTILIVSVLLFCFLPFDGNQIVIVSGIGRVAFVTISFLIVLCFYKMKLTLPKVISYTLETFGIATYGVYLIHPVVYQYEKFVFKTIALNNQFLLYVTVVASTVLLSVLSYRYFELKMIGVGKKLTTDRIVISDNKVNI